MPSLRFILSTDVDYGPRPDLSAARRVAPSEIQTARLVRAHGGGFVPLPSGDLVTITTVFLAADRALSVAFNDTGEGAFLLSAGAVLWVVGGSFPAVSVFNGSGAPATLDYAVAG